MYTSERFPDFEAQEDGKSVYDIDERLLQPGAAARIAAGLIFSGFVVLLKNVLFEQNPRVLSAVADSTTFLESDKLSAIGQKVGHNLKPSRPPDAEPEQSFDDSPPEPLPGRYIEAPKLGAPALLEDSLPVLSPDDFAVRNMTPQPMSRNNVVSLNDFARNNSGNVSAAGSQGSGAGGAGLGGGPGLDDAFDPDLFDLATGDDSDETPEFDVGDQVDEDPQPGDGDDSGDEDPVGNRAPVVYGPANLGNLLVNQVFLITMSSLLINAFDPDGDSLSVVNLSASSGTLQADGAHEWVFQPDFQDVGTVTFSYGVADGEATTAHSALLDLVPLAGRNIEGSSAADRLIGTQADDSIVGYDGDDSISARAGDDLIDGGPGSDRIFGGDGADIIFGSAGDDQIFGQGGSDTIFGGAGDDSLFGGDGADTIFGEDGDDFITAGAGSDDVSGGDGDDWVLATNMDGDDSYDGGRGLDTYDFSANSADTAVDLAAGTAYSSGTGADRLFGFENVIGGAGNDVIVARVHIADVNDGPGGDVSAIPSGDVNDVPGDSAIEAGHAAEQSQAAGLAPVPGDPVDNIIISQTDERISGSDGNDLIIATADRISGGDGNDRILVRESSRFDGNADDENRIDGGEGNDHITAGIGSDDVRGGEGNDIIVATYLDGDDSYDGGSGNDTYDFSAISADTAIDLNAGTAFSAETGNDQIRHFENVIGGAGDDVIVANRHANVLTGGAGNDTFIFEDSGNREDEPALNRDRITDFEVGDTIDVSRIDADENNEGQQLFELLAGRPDAIEPGQIWYYHDMFEEEERTYVDFFVNDDEQVDIGLELMGYHELTKDDFYGVA